MAILINGKLVWQPADIAYCYLDDLLKGPFIIHKVLPDGSYQGKFVGGMAPDFSTVYQVKGESLSLLN